MARMSIDDSIARDPKITVLARLLKWSRRETVGCLICEVWPICYDQRTHLVATVLIDAAANHEGFTAALIEADLAHLDKSGKVYVHGAKERIAYLESKSRAGRQGGLKSAELRASTPKQTSSTAGSTPQARRNPSVTASAPDVAASPVPVEVQENTQSDLPVAGVSEPRSRKSKSVTTPAERDVAARVLAKLSEHNGISYRLADDHVRLIARQLRAGVSEIELRAVIAYCAVDKDWKHDDRMRGYLRPETLFGPENISKYLDGARTTYAEMLAKHAAAQSQLPSTPQQLLPEAT